MSSGGSTKTRILLVDDDRSIVEAMQVRFASSGYEVLTAHDGAQGLAAATGHQPHLILMDIRMPIMDGLTMLARLRAQESTRDIPVVAVSASYADRKRALDAGANMFLEKPFESRDLKLAIAAVLGPSDPANDSPGTASVKALAAVR